MIDGVQATVYCLCNPTNVVLSTQHSSQAMIWL